MGVATEECLLNFSILIVSECLNVIRMWSNENPVQYALVGSALLPQVEYWNRRQRCSGTVPLLSVQCSASVNKGQGRGLLLGHNSGLPRPPRSVNRGHTQPGKIHISFTRHLLGNSVFPPIREYKFQSMYLGTNMLLYKSVFILPVLPLIWESQWRKISPRFCIFPMFTSSMIIT